MKGKERPPLFTALITLLILGKSCQPYNHAELNIRIRVTEQSVSGVGKTLQCSLGSRTENVVLRNKNSNNNLDVCSVLVYNQ